MDWKQSLDRWLTTPPDDGFDGYCESVINALQEQFYEANEDWTQSMECDKLLNQCFADGMSIQAAARFIENYKTLNT